MTRTSATVLTVLVPSLVLAASPARADEDAIGLSWDGTHWSRSLGAPLFDPDVRWVPGDVRTARFYVRNQHPDNGDLNVDLERVRRDELLDTGWLKISARAGDRPWSSVSTGGLQELLVLDDLRSGRAIPVEVRVRMGEEAPNGTMVLSTDLDLRITISDADTVAGDEGSTDDDDPVAGPGIDLPGTGSAIAPWLPPLALALLGTGTWLVVRRRRDADDTEDTGDADLDLEVVLSEVPSSAAPTLSPGS